MTPAGEPLSSLHLLDHVPFLLLEPSALHLHPQARHGLAQEHVRQLPISKRLINSQRLLLSALDKALEAFSFKVEVADVVESRLLVYAKEFTGGTLFEAVLSSHGQMGTEIPQPLTPRRVVRQQVESFGYEDRAEVTQRLLILLELSLLAPGEFLQLQQNLVLDLKRFVVSETMETFVQRSRLASQTVQIAYGIALVAI